MGHHEENGLQLGCPRNIVSPWEKQLYDQRLLIQGGRMFETPTYESLETKSRPIF